MLKGDTLSGKPSSGSYVNQIHDNISLVFDQAVKEGILVKNPCHAANPPKMDTREKKAMRPEQARALVEALDPAVPRECAYLIGITMGLRRGEICGLSRGDIDFERHVVDVSPQLRRPRQPEGDQDQGGHASAAHPGRHVPGARHPEGRPEGPVRQDQLVPKARGGLPRQDESTPVVATHYGERVTPGSLSRWWKQDSARLGLEGWNFTSCATPTLTLLALNGVHPKVMQELAGHYSSQITMEIYTHVNMEAKRDAVSPCRRSSEPPPASGTVLPEFFHGGRPLAVRKERYAL